MSKPFLAKIPISLASQAGSSAEAVELYPTISWVVCANATDKQSDTNSGSATMDCFMGAAAVSNRTADNVRGTQSLPPRFPLSFAQPREVGDFARSHFPADTRRLSRFIDGQPQTRFGDAAVLVERLCCTVVGRRCSFFIDFHPLHDGLNGAVAILMQIAVRLDAGFDNALQLVGIFLDLFDARDQTRVRITEQVVSPRQHHVSQFLSEIIHRSGSGQIGRAS